MTRRLQRAAVASTGEVESAAEELLRKGNALDAVVAGVFAACALSPGVLLGPVQILVGGGGTGLRALDGRVRQPGIGAPRPRGFKEDEDVPDAARVGVPWLPATLSVAVATAGTSTFAAVLAPALAISKGSARHDVLARIAGRGPRAIEESPLSSELLASCGRTASGLLTADDLSSPRPEVHPAVRHVLRAPVETVVKGKKLTEGGRYTIALPWANESGGLPTPPDARVPIATSRVCAAVDRFGSFAIASWDEGVDGLVIDELGLRAPFWAEPVLRGETRVRPGDPRAAAAPFALVATDAGPEHAIAAFAAGDAYDMVGAAVRSVLDDDRIEASGEAHLLGLSHLAGTVTVLR